MSHRRIRKKQTLTLPERLMKAAEEARLKAQTLEPGKAKDALLDKARQFESQIPIGGFVQTPGARLT
jgi:hypothetical protein